MKNPFILFSTFSLFYYGLCSQILPSDLQWNENETGYYTIKKNNIVLVNVKGEEDATILSSDELGEISVEDFIFSKTIKNQQHLMVFEPEGLLKNKTESQRKLVRETPRAPNPQKKRSKFGPQK